jgi:hypothetical protein
MKYARGLATLLVILGGVTEARAQLVIGGPGVAFGYRSRSVGIGVTLGGSIGFSPAYPRYGLGNPYWGPRYSSGVVILAPVPVVAVPQPTYISPSISLAPRIVRTAPPPEPAAEAPQRQEPNLVDPIVIRPRNDRQMPDADAPLPGAIAGGFRPIRPEDRARAMQPVPPVRPVEAKMPPLDRKPLAPPPPEAPPADPLVQGKQAFADREYGRAVRFFKQAVEARPNDFLTHFLLGQAQFAVGKYREAVASIHAGLRLSQDWPASRFKPPALYGPNAADYGDHMNQLLEALKQNPNDAVLLFLSAYQLWFDGQEDEARRLFGRARKLVAEPRFIDLFLNGPALGPVVAR